MRRKPILTGIVIAGMLLAAAPMAQADESDLAVDVLDTLAVTDTQADVPGYDNNQSSGSFRFPEDVDDDAYGSKADMWDVIYMRDFDPATIKSDDGDVSYGVLRNDPYSGKDVTYEKGGSSDIDIEHVVARSEAWDSGASEWTQAQRDAFANDPLELLAVSSGGNRAHGEKDAAGWLPSVGVKSTGVNNPAYDCLYVACQIAVKDKYDLSVDKDEKNAMSDVLATCPAQTIPDEQDGAYWENDTPSTGLAGDVNGDGKYTIDDIPDIQLVNLDEQPIDGFDYRKHVYDLNEETLHAQFRNCPNGWDVTAAAISNNTGQEIHGAYVLSPDGQVVTAYYFTNNQGSPSPDADMNGDGEYTIDDFTGVGFTVDGNPLDGFSPDTHEYTLPDGGEHDIKASGNPSWLHVEAKNPSSTADKGFRSVTHMFTSPDLRTTVSYRFTWNVPVEQMPGDVNGDGEYTTGA